MRYLIVGPCASGKDTAAAILREKGLKQLVSYTDRPRRPGEGKTHVFVSTNNLPKENIIAKTKIGDYTYLATREQFDEADVYVIDPNGVKDLDSRIEPESVDLIFVNANTDERLKRWLERDNSQNSYRKFLERTKSERYQFAAFERSILRSDKPFNCVRNLYVYTNERGEEDLRRALDEILQETTDTAN